MFTSRLKIFFFSFQNQAKIKLHGSQIEALHEFIDPAILPKDMLGEQESNFEWFFESLYEQHEDYVARSELAAKGMGNSLIGSEI